MFNKISAVILAMGVLGAFAAPSFASVAHAESGIDIETLPGGGSTQPPPTPKKPSK